MINIPILMNISLGLKVNKVIMIHFYLKNKTLIKKVIMKLKRTMSGTKKSYLKKWMKLTTMKDGLINMIMYLMELEKASQYCSVYTQLMKDALW